MNRPSAIKKVSSEPDPDETDSGAPGRRCVTSEALLRGRREVRIVHAGQEYRLSVTSKGKLILTK